MQILFDHQIFCLQKYGGVSKYFVELLKRIPPNVWDTTVYFSNNEYIKDGSLINHHKLLPGMSIRGIGRATNEFNKIYAIRKLLRGNFDVYHQTHYQTFSFPFLTKKPLVTTFHDMNFLRFNHSELQIQKKSVERANKIIAISQNTKNDLIETWNIPEEKVTVIYHGVDVPIQDSIIGERIIKEPYILYVGLRAGYKNFNAFAKAFSVIVQKYPFLKLVCTGLPFTKEEVDMLKQLRILDHIEQMSASEVGMANLYSYAELFVYPSLFEGFGMPILEAFSYKCPTVISNASCFPEIAGDCAFYFDPNFVESMIFEITNLLDNSELRKSKIERAQHLCEDFTWEKCAGAHLRVYESLV